MAVRQLRSQIQRIAPYFRTALIRGEVGAGKELVGRSLHALSQGAAGPFIVAQAAQLAASANGRETSGQASLSAIALLVESARGGTLYIEGVDELSPGLQVAMVRFLRGVDLRRPALASPANFGGNEVRHTDLRILAACEGDLRTLSAVGRFRQDLYIRLAGVEIFVPGLDQRVEDIPELACGMLRQYAEQKGEGVKLLDEAAAMKLQESLWPNLRELARVVRGAAAVAEEEIIELRHLRGPMEAISSGPAARSGASLVRLQDVVLHHVLKVLTRCEGNKQRAAELLGISRSTLYRMLDASQQTGRS